MTKANAKSAIATASEAEALKAKTAEMLKSLPADVLAAIMAQMGTPAATPAPKAHDLDALRNAANAFVGKLVKVTDGRKHKGETLKAYIATKGNAMRKPLVLCEGDEQIAEGVTPIFMNPAYLEIVGDMTQADLDRLTAVQKAASDETLYIQAYATRESDAAIQISYPAWAKNVWFSKAKGDNAGMISIAATLPDGAKIFEIAAWQVKKQCGTDAYNALVAKQAELEKMVNAA